MTSMDFMNDFYFLEEATRFTKNIIENPAVNRKGCLNFKFVKLKKEAFKRNIKLYLVNNGLSKRRKNYSSYKGQEDTIYWQIELIFPNAENLKLTRKFSEKIILQDIIRNVLETTSANERLAKQLEFYRAEGANKLRCLLKAEGLKRCKQRYFEMDSEKSLKANLMGKVIIEFPSIHVVMRHSADCFEVVDSDGKFLIMFPDLGKYYCYCCSLFNILDEEQVQNEIKNFRQTVHDEVLSKKIGENPPIAELKPEEIPLIATMFADKVEESQTPLETVYHAAEDFDIKSTEDDVEGEVEPQNYFF